MSTKAYNQIFQARFAATPCRRTAPHPTFLLRPSPFLHHDRSTRSPSRPRADHRPSPRCLHQRRAFTSTPAGRAGVQMPKSRATSAPSMRRMNQEQMAQMMKAGTMLDHLGVIDGQYVKPTGANAPSWRSSPLARLSLEIRSRITALRLRCTSYYVRRWKISPPVPAPPTAEIIRATKALYEDIYTAFGNGDLAPVRDRLAPGFHDTLSQHIRERRPDTTRQWRLERYVGEPRVVSCIVGLLPNEAEAATAAKAKTGQAETAAAKAKAKKAAKEAAKAAKRDANGMLQAIVRIRSVQSLVTVARKRTWDRARRTTVEESVPLNQRGEEISAAGAEEVRKATARESVEYFVVQKKIRHSRVDPDWQAWGAAQESTPERIAYEAALRDARMEEQTRRQAAGEV